MESLNRYLDNVKAKPELKTRTGRYIEEKISGRRRLRRLTFVVCALFAFCVLSVGGYAYYQTPVGYVSIDINPSVELGVNAFNRVVSARAANADGEVILDRLNLKNKAVGEAINDLVCAAVDCNFIADDGSSVVALTAQSRNEENAEELKELCVSGADRALSDADVYAAVLGESSDFDLRAAAQELGVSPGKYKLIAMLKVLDPTINIEDYADEKVGDIMEKAKELAGSGDYGEGNGEIGKILGDIASYSDKSSQARKKAKNNSGNNGNMSTERNSDSTQNTETNCCTEQNGSTNEYSGSNNSNGNNSNNGNGPGNAQDNTCSGSSERETGASGTQNSAQGYTNGQNGQNSEPPAYRGGNGNENSASKKG